MYGKSPFNRLAEMEITLLEENLNKGRKQIFT